MPPLLTIGVPTFNRSECIMRLAKELVAHEAHKLADILVIDDGGEDGTFEALKESPVASVAGIRILGNDVNRGYAYTFNRIFEECRTDYLMMMADDDSVVFSNIPALIDFLHIEKPDFVSTQFLIGDTVYRGKTESTKIKPEEFFQSSAHAPGLVYRVNACSESLELVRARADMMKADALVYPQVVMLINLMHAAANCRWLALPMVIEAEAAPSGIRDASGSSYWALDSRWRQLKDFDDLLVSQLRENDDVVGQAMLNAQRDRVFGHLVVAMESEKPELRIAFDKSARLFYLKQTIKKLLQFDQLARFMSEKLSNSKI